MAKTVEERVADALKTVGGDSDQEKALKLVEWFRDANKDLAEGVRRSVLFYFLTVLAFELVVTANLKEVTISGAKLTELPSLIVFAPTIAAYFYLESIILSIRCGDLHDAVREAMKAWNGASIDNDIELLMRPRVSLLWPIGIGPRKQIAPRLRLYEWKLFVVFLVLAVALELVFTTHAFWWLGAQDSGPQQALLWFNAGATGSLLVACLPYVSYFESWPRGRRLYP